ncbi:hypothetical protein [Aestuariivita sp.]|jgi:hypothetical protein|uniref:hypothetical protein n=1 Tax=Aestuariivita sp. TaxID=1872407 RepID=UPI0021702479|nr:hypothetical protein [Aestuariivita sp.]MCE8007394.1 hypothetical protein [Aestuariivita sp.]
MSIWTSKARRLVGLAVLATLAACDTLTLPGLGAGGGSAPVTRAAMSDGALQLATPQGYCIDQRSLRDRFALLGRCDTLGVQGTFGAWELAIVTVSLAPVEPGTVPADVGAFPAAPGSDEVLRTLERGDLTLTQLRTQETPVDGTSGQYWRTAFVLNGQLVSLALYAPDTSQATGDEGARILQDIARATRTATAV